MDAGYARLRRKDVGRPGVLPRSRGSRAGEHRTSEREAVLRRLALVLLAAVLASCSAQGSPQPARTSPSSAATPPQRLGPGGLTLDEEVGAVIMAGFQGPVTDAVLADWKRHQFGGLLVVNLNYNATTAASMSS